MTVVWFTSSIVIILVVLRGRCLVEAFISLVHIRNLDQKIANQKFLYLAEAHQATLVA